MAIKILLADKSITIQKVVEMLFSGREYEVTCASDGETALNEAARIVPDVVLADVDLPRIDGYSFAARLRQRPGFDQTPVILMLSRDDVLDSAKAKQAGIIDSIQKPFESQELIGKVKKAVASAPPRLAEPARPEPARPTATPPPAEPAPAARAQQAPSDIFDIIKEAPRGAEFERPAPAEEAVFEVEPVVEMEEPRLHEEERALPLGEKAVEEIRMGLGLTPKKEAPKETPPPEFTSFESLDMATAAAREYTPPQSMPEPVQWQPAAGPAEPPISEDALRGIAEETISRIAREVLEKVAWEVIPDLAERLIKEEIERLKAGI